MARRVGAQEHRDRLAVPLSVVQFQGVPEGQTNDASAILNLMRVADPGGSSAEPNP